MTENDRTDQRDNLAQGAAETMLGPNPFVGLRLNDMADSLIDVWSAMLRNPYALVERQTALLKDLASPPATTAHGRDGDKRFADEEWRTNPVYQTLMQSYLTWSKSVVDLVDDLDIDQSRKARARFVLGLIADGLSPTNTLIGNPAAIKKTLETQGASLTAGLSNFLSDLVDNDGMPSQVDKGAFQVGKNVASTKGAVVFRNEVLELIQYAPTTPEVHSRPHLFIPPQINKFYVFDLSPEKSLVRFLVDKGFQVFLVSWRNPTAANRDWNLGTYVSALREAIDAVKSITGSDDLIPHAACSGAMTSVVLASLLETDHQRSIHAITLMVAVLGNESDTQLGLFATPEIIEIAKQQVAAKGVLEGREMGRVFAWMRPNDLVWNYWVNNYLLGNRPPAFDILYWNNDTTRLPARFHAELLDILGQGLLLKPNIVKVNDTPIDISAIKAEKFVVAGSTDHITPWRGVYKMAQALGGNVEFILSTSGHIQSLVNPPGNRKSKYNVGSKLEPTADLWLAASTVHQGSWWDRWAEWLKERSSQMIAAKTSLGNRQYEVLGEAPGKYVHEL